MFCFEFAFFIFFSHNNGVCWVSEIYLNIMYVISKIYNYLIAFRFFANSSKIFFYFWLNLKWSLKILFQIKIKIWNALKNCSTVLVKNLHRELKILWIMFWSGNISPWRTIKILFLFFILKKVYFCKTYRFCKIQYSNS